MQGVANEQALMESIYMAIDLYRHRMADDEARSNVLPLSLIHISEPTRPY